MPRFPIIPSEHPPLNDDSGPFPTSAVERNDESSEAKHIASMAEVSLDSVVFLFQVLMALALQNGAYIFITGGNGGYALRPWQSVTLYGALAFLTFVATLIPFAHANVLILKQSYMAGFGGRGLQPISDFFLLFLEAAIFYAWSHSLATIDSNFIVFFVVAGAILAVDVFWALLTYSFDPRRRIVLIYAFLNSLTLALGIIAFDLKAPHLRYVLLTILAVRTSLDYSLTYNLLFPGAFRSLAKPLRQPAARGTVSIRNLSLVAMLLLGASVFSSLVEQQPCESSCVHLEPVVIPLFFVGLIVTAITLALSLIIAASRKQWSWLISILLFTSLVPLTASALGIIVFVSSTSWLRIAGSLLFFLSPVIMLLYGIRGKQ